MLIVAVSMAAVEFSPIGRHPVQCLEELFNRDRVVKKERAFGQQLLDILCFGDEQKLRCGCVFARRTRERNEESDKDCRG